MKTLFRNWTPSPLTSRYVTSFDCFSPLPQLPVSRRAEREPRTVVGLHLHTRGPHQGDTGAVRAVL